MATRITLLGGRQIIVREDFDAVMEKFWPTSQASSAIEARGNAIYTRHSDALRILVATPSVSLIEENVEEIDDDN